MGYKKLASDRVRQHQIAATRVRLSVRNHSIHGTALNLEVCLSDWRPTVSDNMQKPQGFV